MSARGIKNLALALALALCGCPGPAPPAPPKDRKTPAVITSSPALAEMICAIGGREHLVGVSRYCVYPPELEGLPQIGGMLDPNLEAIDALDPDLVLLQGQDPRLRALSERRNLAAAGHIEKLLSEHPNSIVAAQLP